MGSQSRGEQRSGRLGAAVSLRGVAVGGWGTWYPSAVRGLSLGSCGSPIPLGDGPSAPAHQCLLGGGVGSCCRAAGLWGRLC